MKTILEQFEDLLAQLPPRPLWEVELKIRYGGWVSEEDQRRLETSRNLVVLKDYKKSQL